MLTTVNAVVVWLNARFGLSLPTLPLAGWPSVMVTLWKMAVPGPVPPPISSPDRWEIPIAGSLPGMLPPTATLELTNLCLIVDPAPVEHQPG
ncbi:MAG: hypothetical protein ACREF4_16985 [Gammaproteobacteria bacterium]